MESFDLKEIWKKERDGQGQLSDHDMDQILRDKTEGIMASVAKKTKIEHYLNVSFLILGTIGLYFWEGWMVSVAFAIVVSLTIFYFKRLYNSVNSEVYSEDTYHYLLEVKKKVQQFLRQYTLAVMSLVTVSFCVGFWYGHETNEGTLPDLWVIVVSVILGLGICYAVVYLIVFLLYGKPLRKVKKVLEEFEAER